MQDLSPRQQSVLNRVVDTHIETAQPVGSRSLTALYTELYHGSYSSATVRHEMELLEDKGYLTHPHTSAGRIPTDRGYRYYVDYGLRQETLIESRMRSVTEALFEVRDELESLAEHTSSVLADLAEEVSLVLVPEAASRIPRRGESSFRVFLQGSSHVLEKPEFQDVRKIRILFKAFEERTQWAEWLASHTPEAGVSVIIGRENQPQAFWECSIVSTRLDLSGRRKAVLAVVGPRRMRYARLLPLVQRMGQIMASVSSSADSDSCDD